MPLLNIPHGYAQQRNQPDFTKTAQYTCPKCGWSGFARMSFKGEPVDPCPHRSSSPFEEWR